MLAGLLAATAALAAPPAKPAPITGVALHVVDGDTLVVAPAGGGKPLTVRLEGIDAPEICQAWGPQARDALQALVDGRELALSVKGVDDHGRTLGRVQAGDTDVGDRLVRDGHAWSYRYRHDKGPYVAQERMAQALSRGLHAAGGALMPRDFRRHHGSCWSDDMAAAAPSAAGAAAQATATAGATPAVTPAAPSAGTVLDLRAETRRCDGRTRCTQMRSCAEATWFLRNCPGTEMDGDGDGMPCERQWCGR